MPDPLDRPSASPELLQVMFGQAASLVVSTSPRLDRWSDAFTDWLVSIAAARGRGAYLQALSSWEKLLRFHHCPPWELDRSRLEAWTAHLAESGFSANTIRCYQGRISAFFRFCSKRPELLSAEPQFGSPALPLNPLRAAPRPQTENYRTAFILRPAEVRRLLRAVDRQSSLVGKRDYAILLTLLLTGLTEAELRLLRWSQVDISSQPVRLVVSQGSPAKELPPPAWEAIHAYLQASGRLAVIQPDDFIFTPLADPLLQPPSGLPEDWRRDRPLSILQMLVFLKAYAAWAGLDGVKVTYACLRHTSALLCIESGMDAPGLQRFLGREYLKDTRRYILHLGGMLARRAPPARRFARGRFLPPRGPYLRKKTQPQPDNKNTLKHGFYSKNPPEAGPQDLLAAKIAKLDDEIAALRLLLHRAFTLAGRPTNSTDALRFLDLYGLSATRLSRMLVKRQKLHAQDVDAAFETALIKNTNESDAPDRPE